MKHLATELLPEWSIQRELPANLKEPERSVIQKLLTAKSRKVKSVIYHNATVNSELYIKQKKRPFHIVPESFGDHWQYELYNKYPTPHKSFIKDLLRKKVKINTALCCLDLFSTGGYFHWLTEILPKYFLAKKHLDNDIDLLIPYYFLEKWGFVSQIIEALNISVHWIKNNEIVEVRELVAISSSGGPLNYQPEPIKILSKTLLQIIDSSRSTLDGLKRIYISRSKASWRKILNEKEILPVLATYDIELVHLEDYSFLDQVKLLSSCNFLIGCHGAGLTNMIFMPMNSSVMEIRLSSSDHMMNVFFTLAHTVSLNYIPFVVDDFNEGLHNDLRKIDQSFSVDISLLSTQLGNFFS